MTFTIHSPEFLDAVRRVADSLAARWVIGFSTADDVRQDVFLLCASALPRFDPAKFPHKPPAQALAGFLFVHCSNKLINKKRDKFHRGDSKCPRCAAGDHCEPGGCRSFREWRSRNAQKSSLYQAAEGVGPGRGREGGRGRGDDRHRPREAAGDDPALREVFAGLDGHVPADLRTDWLRLRAQARFPKGRKAKLLQKLREILERIGVRGVD